MGCKLRNRTHSIVSVGSLQDLKTNKLNKTLTGGRDVSAGTAVRLNLCNQLGRCSCLSLLKVSLPCLMLISSVARASVNKPSSVSINDRL